MLQVGVGVLLCAGHGFKDPASLGSRFWPTYKTEMITDVMLRCMRSNCMTVEQLRGEWKMTRFVGLGCRGISLIPGRFCLRFQVLEDPGFLDSE